MKQLVIKNKIEKPYKRAKAKSTIEYKVPSIDTSIGLPPVSNYISRYKQNDVEGVITPIGQRKIEQQRQAKIERDSRKLGGKDIFAAMDPVNRNLTKLIRFDIENKKNVVQNVHHVQYAILEAKKDFEDTHGAGNQMDLAFSRLENSLRDNR